jgi:putative DNA-invertase from lambdoid prophage Rac
MGIMDAYVRVSQKGDREGESYRSPALQEDEIRRWARADGVTLALVETDEDVSGGKAVADRKLGKLIGRAESGVTEGVVVFALDRFGRDELDAALAIKRLRDAGGRVVSASEGVDSRREDPGSKMALKIYLMFAEAHLDRIRANWKKSSESAAASGIQCGKATIGYVRKDQVEPEYNVKGELIPNGRLMLDKPSIVEAVRRAFEIRAQGGTYPEGTRVIEEALGRKLSRNTLRQMVKSRTYLGEIRRGDVLVKDAHEAIITPELFAAASVKHTERKVARRPRGETAAELTLLSGLVRCAGCGGVCKVQRSGKDRVPFYVCAPGRVGNPCPPDQHAGASAKSVDDYVIWLLANDAGTATKAAASEQQRWLEAREVLRAAEGDLAEWMDDEEASSSTRKAMILKAEKKANAARVALYELPDPDLDEDASVLWLDGKPIVYDLMGEDREKDRRTLLRHVGSVTITKSKRGRWEPIEQRIAVTWKDGSEPVIAVAA